MATMTMTIPVLVLSLTLGACVLTGCGSFKSKPAQSAVAMQRKLSDSYATSALLALKAIQRDPYVPAKGSQLVSRFTQEKIDAADVAAVSDEEKNVTSTLNAVYHAQLSLNKLNAKSDARWADAEGDKPSGVPSRSCHEVPPAKRKYHPAWDAYCAMLEQLDSLEAPGKKELTEKLNTCFSDFDASLRARSTNVPAPCADPGPTDALAAYLKQGT